ncbi:MtrAB system histidine kinase MtrB [Bailinhaonella thermotolerans]|uniref:Sensor histidine kinase MtrB n=1 Tax=Bailinhaonella thermotolerans TaxID=1070861 RepID=A0A3A4B8K7_9ACTN|nr:MtrAB system histidine kinase MtrB [Bailinhaonella thermotolerans]RJL30458.1 sensor histidine kinase [Bailinhaonella thermotolerans]
MTPPEKTVPWRRRARKIPRALRRGARRVVGAVRRRWRRSLQLRVVASTLLISAAVVAVLGFFLMQQITLGTLDARKKAAVADAAADRQEAQRLLDPQAQPESAPQPGTGVEVKPRKCTLPVERAVCTLAQRAGVPARYEIIIIPADGSPAMASNSILASSIPPGLMRQVRSAPNDEPRPYSQAAQLRYIHQPGKPVPGWVVGGKIEGGHQIYHLFPLVEEEEALSFVSRVLIAVGAALVLLLAAIASLVTRQVVTPVRLARQAAERLASGRLEERLRVRGEDDLARLAASFNQMAGNLALKITQLEELSQVQRQFVSDVSHELRTPLTTVRMAADLIYDERESFDPALARSAELLQNQLERFESLLADLLEISRYDAGAATLDTDPVDVRDLVLRAVGHSEALAERHSTKLVLRLPSEPCMAEVDGRRVERILRNLLFNAIEHGEGRDIVVTVGADRDAVAVAVRDHGVGLKPGEENLVFDRFWRADPARTRTIGGTGLGLAISREDAMLHGGWLQAWGMPGEGSQFRLSLPRQKGAELRGSPLPLVPPEVEMRRAWRAIAPVAPETAEVGTGASDGQ